MAAAGSPLPNANWGPFFGASDQEILAVSDKGAYLTRNGAETWTRVAPQLPGIWLGDRRTVGLYFAWDAAHRILYAAHAGSGFYRLRLPEPLPTAP